MINIAEILKYCPSGMELDSTDYSGEVIFEQVIDSDAYPIKISVKYGNNYLKHSLTEYGQTYGSQYNKCVIFPKGKTTWEGFQKPFKDGDVCTSKEKTVIMETVNHECYVSMENYTMYCTEEQTVRAIELGAPILPTCYSDGFTKQMLYTDTHSPLGKSYYDIPTAEQMCGWLQEKGVKITYDGIGYQVKIEDLGCLTDVSRHFFRNDAIDAALDYLEKNVEK